MKNIGSNLGRTVIFAAFLLTFATLRSTAQLPSTDAEASSQTSAAQIPRVLPRVTQSVDESNRVALRGNVHPLARAAFDRGSVSDAQLATHVSLVLKRSDDQETALEQLLAQQQDKSSPNYHKWLTPEQFGKQFGPADSDIQAVTDWLTSRGFTNIQVSPGRMHIEFSGNIGQINNAFQTQVHNYLVNGKMHMANASEPQIPAALSPVIRGVAPLHDFRPHALSHRLGTFRHNKDTHETKPLFTFGSCGTSTPCYAVGPGDFAKIYNIPTTVAATSPGVSGIPGTGVTIAIVQDSNINPADVAAYRTMWGLPANPVKVIVNGPDPGIQGPDSQTDDEIEADLDVQLAGGVAPGATIDLVVSQDSFSVGLFGTDLSAIYIIDNNLAPVLSESFGACEASLTASNESFYVDLWQQASAQGITAVISAGDNGPAACDPSGSNQDVASAGIGVSGFASTPYNVALGGTDFQNAGTTQNQPSGNSTFWNTPNATSGTFLQTSAKGYVPEWPWNDTCAVLASASNLGTCTNAIVNANSDPNAPNFGNDIVAGSGGPSMFNTKPAYQTSITGMPAANFRQLPDVSFFSGNGANASFYIICQEDANTGTGSSTSSCNLTTPFADFQGVGGTSAAAPAFAGVMAMVNQKTGQRQGNANFVLYNLYKHGTASTICQSSASPASTCIFYDTVLGNNSVACSGSSPNCSNTAAGSFGVVLDPTKTKTPAFVTTTNYDNATGLGSLNINNLLNAWSTASFTADTVTLSVNPSTSTHGDPVTFIVTVTPSTATGTFALIATPPAGSPVGIGSFFQSDQTFTLTGGTAQIATTEVPGGTGVSVVARYAGDGTFAPGISNAVTLNVAKEASKTAVNLVTFDSAGNQQVNKVSSIAYGANYVLQLAVSDSQSRQCASIVSACPTGTISLTDNGQPLDDFGGSNTAMLTSLAFADDISNSLATGTHSLVATYNPGTDPSYTGSTSPAKAVTVTAASTNITVTAAPASGVTTGTPVTLTAKVNTPSMGAGPTGSIAFSINNNPVGTAVAVIPTAGNFNSGAKAFATASITHTFLIPGNATVTATYTSGDTNYASGTVGSTTVAVTTTGTVPTTAAVTASATTVTSGGMVTLNSTITSSTKNGPGVTGAVQFMNGTQALGSPVNCTSTAGTTTTAATCTASLSTALSSVPPAFFNPSNRAPRTPPAAPLALATCILALLLLIASRRSGSPAHRRLVYGFACALFMIGIITGFAGCGGGSSGGGNTTPTTHVDSITAVYGGDSTYIGSTSPAVAVTVSNQ